jgi:hypothetical protein
MVSVPGTDRNQVLSPNLKVKRTVPLGKLSSVRVNPRAFFTTTNHDLTIWIHGPHAFQIAREAARNRFYSDGKRHL